MAWKNLKQRSLGDALLIDHEALQELDGVHGLIDCDVSTLFRTQFYIDFC
jgi:hypothetical protein